jgi:hypothetical protein
MSGQPVSLSPEFPIRILFDDGEAVVIETPEEIADAVDALDSDDPRVWVRDALDRNVRLLVRNGGVEALAVISD